MKRFLILCVLIGCVAWTWHASTPVDTARTTTEAITIESGASLADIASLLMERKIIRSAMIFQLRTWIAGASSSLKAGTYELSPSLTLPAIIELLLQGSTKEMHVTIPEGLTVRQIDALMAAKGLGKEGDILECARRCDFSTFDFLPTHSATNDPSVGSRLEGYLFPETYAVPVLDYHPKFFLERMLGTFRSRIIDRYEKEIHTSKRTLQELTTMASLIEEESRRDDERATIAGILWKRLENGIVLGVDATTRYEHDKSTAPITKEELETLTPYNTRRKRGLPPSPIANAGEASFRAALHPIASQFWYYLHGTDGTIRYAKTDAEHVENKRKYLR